MTKQYTNKPNSGVLFPQKDKKSDRAPDFTGNIEIGEDVLEAIRRGTSGTVKLRLAGWKKTSDKVGVYLSLSVSADEDKQFAKRPPSTGYGKPPATRKSFDDDDSTPW